MDSYQLRGFVACSLSYGKQKSLEECSADDPNSASQRLARFPKNWFTLSAYAFPTKMVKDQDGYTLLRLASEDDDDGIKADSLGTYLLWEMSDSSTP